MLYPYAISQTCLLGLIGVALCGWLYVAWRRVGASSLLASWFG